MKRGGFITLLGGAVAWPLAARAQQEDIALWTSTKPDQFRPNIYCTRFVTKMMMSLERIRALP